MQALGRLRLAGLTAVAAAAAATAGDLLLLDASSSATDPARRGLGSHAGLLAGHYLGILAIPLYGVGYWQVARGLEPGGLPLGRVVLWLGVSGAILGSAIHAVTGILVRVAAIEGGSGGSSVSTLRPYAAYLAPLWVLVLALMVAGSAVFAFAVLRRETRFPRWIAAFSPIVLVTVCTVVSLPSQVLRAFLLPAGPNLAHLIFFGLTAALLWRR